MSAHCAACNSLSYLIGPELSNRMIVPVYQSEISEAENRGKLACIEFTGNIIGYASSVWVDYFASYFESDLQWRFPLSIQIIIGAILAAGSLVIPESPRYVQTYVRVSSAHCPAI